MLPPSCCCTAFPAPDASSVSPDGYSLDNFYLARPGADEVQLDLFGDNKSNVALYPLFQAYFREHKPPLLAIWGRNDPFFLPAGAKAFTRDPPDADVCFLDTGHFALETHAGKSRPRSAISFFADSPGSRSAWSSWAGRRCCGRRARHQARPSLSLQGHPRGPSPDGGQRCHRKVGGGARGLTPARSGGTIRRCVR